MLERRLSAAHRTILRKLSVQPFCKYLTPGDFKDLDIKPQGLENFGKILYKDQQTIYGDARAQRRVFNCNAWLDDVFFRIGLRAEDISRSSRKAEDSYLKDISKYFLKRDSILPAILKAKYARWAGATTILALVRATEGTTRPEVSEALLISSRRVLFATAQVSDNYGESVEPEVLQKLSSQVVDYNLEGFDYSLRGFVNCSLEEP